MGCTATDPSSGQQGKPGDFSKLFRRVFPAVLRLAVDLDETTRTLFSKLSMQLVRWFSQVRFFPEGAAVLHVAVLSFQRYSFSGRHRRWGVRCLSVKLVCLVVVGIILETFSCTSLKDSRIWSETIS